ncbi:MAG: TonB-dependent receptor [Bryobacterales bacterium]|nr:TonB-dependent receptor [Bryobacterales bacterium]
MNRSLSIALLLIASALCHGQNAQVTGIVKDSTDAGIPNARVVVTNTDTEISRRTASNDQGIYVVPLLQPGRYRISVQSDGFKPIDRQGITLAVDQVARIDFVMQIGQMTESVNVTAETPRVDQETSSLGQVIENKRIVEMPLNGRNVMSLIQLTAGVTPQAGINAGFADPAGFVTSNVAIGGGRGSMNQLLFDGANNAAPERQEIAVSPSVDAVAEFKVYTNGAPAEFGRTTGGAISMVTKSGTNQLHGTLYEFFRNDKLDSRNTFAATRAPFRYNQYGGSAGAPVVLPKIYNGKNRTFWFFNYEGYRYITYANNVLSVPTELQRAGNFSETRLANGTVLGVYDPESTAVNPNGAGFVRTPFPGNTIPTSRFNRIPVQILRDVPLPNRAPTNAITNVNNYGEQTRRLQNNDQYIGRFDHNVDNNNRLTYRLAYNYNVIRPDSQFGNYLTQGEQNDVFDRNYSQQVASWTYTISPSTFSELRAGYVRTLIVRDPPTSGADLDRLGYPAIIPRVQFPSHNIADFTELGGGQTVDGGLHTISLHESITKVMGKHTLKFGGEVWTIRRNRFQFGGLSGAFNFNRDLTNNPQAPQTTGYGVATFLLGAVNAGSLTIGSKRHERGKYFAGFLQDDWRISRRLTLNVGLRYDVETNAIDHFNERSNFNFFRVNPITNLPGVVEFAGKDYGRHPVPVDRNNLGPRFGFAYTFDESAHTVLRGFYGIFYQGIFESFETNLGWSANTPFANPSIGPRPNFYLTQGPPALVLPPGNSQGAASFLGLGAEGRMADDRVGYTQQWNLSLQRALPGNWVLESIYSAAKGTRLGIGAQGIAENALDPRYLSLGFDLQTQVPNALFEKGIFGRTVARQQTLLPFPAYQGITRRNPTFGSSIYHSLQVNARKSMSRGHTVQLAYTFGKLIDDTVASLSAGFAGYNTGVADYQTPYNRRMERSISPADVSQRLVVSYLWELPFGKGRRFGLRGPADIVLGGWQLSGILTSQTGQPLAVRGANNNAANRPNSTGTSAKLDNPSIGRWLDTSQFVTPPLFTFGNLSRVLPDVRAPGLVQLDFGLQKYVAFGEKVRLQLRAEAFNATNRVNLGPPNVTFTAAAFGTINATATPARVMQLGAKVIF